MSEHTIDTGIEWLVDASQCNGERLRDLATLRALFASIVQDLGLQPAAEPVWKVFDGEGGITGMVLLAESHLTIHTFPEHGHAAINLYLSLSETNPLRHYANCRFADSQRSGLRER